MKKVCFVKSKTTGGHYTFTQEGKKPFENPMCYYQKLQLEKDDVVIDIGAYVGEYSLYAIKSGVRGVIAYEPTPETFKILKMNKKPNMEIINKAVVDSDNEFVKLYLSKGIGVTNSTAKKKSSFIEVPAINYIEAIKGGTVVKIDVEGAEYDYPIINENLRGIILEFHLIGKTNWKELAEDIIQKIEKNGYERIYKPSFDHGWDLTGCWARR